MKRVYEKYDDTVRYKHDDRIESWEPKHEVVTIEVHADTLTLSTEYADGLVSSKVMTIVEQQGSRLIAQHIDEIMGITVFAHDPVESKEATLTLINADYIVGRYLREITAPTPME